MAPGSEPGVLERATRHGKGTGMTLTLRAVSLNDQPLTQPITAHFDAKGGSIGRADQSTLALPDPERHISRRQADIVATADGYRIKNVGSANPIVVRGQPLGQGESTPLSHRDSVRIGGYLLEVSDDASQARTASTITQGRAAVDARAAAAPPLPPRAASPGGSGGLGELGAPLSSSNPFADLMGDAGPPTSAPVQAAAPAAWGTPPPAAPVPRLPDDFDPFAAPPPPATAAPAPTHRAGAFDDLIPSTAPASIDDLFGLPRSQGDPLAAFMAGASTVGEPGATSDRIGGVSLSTDPMALFGAPASPPEGADSRASLADNTPELRGAFRPPGIVVARPAAAELPGSAPVVPAPPPPEAPVNPLPPAPAVSTRSPLAEKAPAAGGWAGVWTDDTRALWAAFSEAAGLHLEPPQGLSPELMRVIGTLMRSAVEGTLQLMAVRAATRVELHAQVTMIQARNNNPLKFSPDAQSALEQMLQPPMRGFLAGPAAMTESMNDLVGHSIGTMAGTRAALEGVLDRFAPQELEAKLASKSVLDSVLPVTRKARLWDLYLQHFDAIRNEAQEDFQTLFGKAFLAAYEQQLDRLRQDKQSNGA
jgi:FHA domain-containing protein